MNRTSVENEVQPGRGKSREEFRGEHVAFEAIAAAARGDEVARNVSTTLGQRVHMVECGDIEFEGGGAVHAAPAAITHCGALDRSLLSVGVQSPGVARDSGDAGKGDAVTLSTPGQGHLAEKAKPRDGQASHHGARQKTRRNSRDRDITTCGALALASRGPNLVVGSLSSLSSVNERTLPLMSISMQCTCRMRKWPSSTKVERQATA